MGDTSPKASPSREEMDTPQPREEPLDPLQGPNKRLSIASAAPAQVSTDALDVQVSLVQPVGLSKTPQHETVSSASTPAPSMSEHHDNYTNSSRDYFSAAAVSSHSFDQSAQPDLGSTSQIALSRQTTRSSDASHKDSPAHFELDAALEHRLAAHRESIAAASTRRSGADTEDTSLDTRRAPPRGSTTEHPHYPNQALSALSTQVYPEPYRAPYASRPSPGRYHASKPSAMFSRMSSPSNSGDERQARTVGNTPIQTPGLFSPRASRFPTALPGDPESPIPSPYLHPVQPQAPKETNKATRDIDTSSGRKTINQYEILYEIGKGAHGKVKLARSISTGENVAIKIVQRYSKRRRLGKAQSQEDKVKKEVAILKKALHPNVVAMLEVIDDPDLHKIYLVLEFCEAHDVRWREFGETEIVIIDNNRLKREMNSEENQDSIGDSDRIVRTANKRLMKKLKRVSTPLSRINSESDFWSLEYGGDFDTEDDDRNSTSSFAGRAADQVYSMERSGAEPKPSIAWAASTHDQSNQSHTDETKKATAESSRHHTESAQPFRRGFLDFQEWQAHLEHSTGESTEHHGDDKADRKPSVAESTSSALSDFVERSIDEEMRYVPLLTIPESRRAFRDALLGIEYLHYQGIIHRDIKPENLLRKSDHSVKISDFGVSYLGKPIRDGRDSEETSDTESAEYHEEETELAKTVGTPAFYAPELCSLDFSKEKPRVTGQIDVWALGVTLYCFIYARLPFQAMNEYVMMRRIDEDDVFFSRKRLKAVDTQAESRSRALGTKVQVSKDHRLVDELLWDEVDDDLHDLLRRLLVKDQSKRITVKEIKHHPWVLRDIPQPGKWLDDTDPARFTQGKKIEISGNDVQEAVAPLRILERAKSVAKKVTGALGLSSGVRKRGQSSATSSEASIHSPGPFSLMSPFGMHDSSRSEDTVIAALKASREQQYHPHSHAEHPLSQSVTASPELSPVDKHASAHHMRTSQSSAGFDENYYLDRPILPTRQESVMSTAGSVRSAKTITQADFIPHEPTSIAASGEDVQRRSSDHTATHSFGQMLGETGRNFLRTVRSRDRGAAGDRPQSQTSRSHSPEHQDVLQGEPSVALSSTSASGQIEHFRARPISPPTRADRSSVPTVRRRPQSGQYHRRSVDMQELLTQNPSFLQLSPASPAATNKLSQPPISSNSSEDRFNSGISRETSLPSVPSAVSADSSVAPDETPNLSNQQLPGQVTKRRSIVTEQAPAEMTDEGDITPSRPSTLAMSPLVLTSPVEGEVADNEQGPQTDEDDSESDEEFLVMNKSKSKLKNTRAANPA